MLFVDIAGSTGLAERLGGVAIHRLLDRTFRLLTLAVVDYRGEVLNYVGDEVIVTWRERDGAVDCRPLRCFAAMRHELSGASSQFEREFGAVPRIRGSLHFGPVIVGEIGDVKRAIVFNGDVMNTAARLEELSRTVDGGFLASRTAMERFSSCCRLPFATSGGFQFADAPMASTWSVLTTATGAWKVSPRSGRLTIRAADSRSGQGRNPLAARWRSCRDLQGRSIVFRAAWDDAPGLG